MPDPSRTQDNRPLALSTALGKDVLLLRRATVTEQLGRPFQIEVEAISESPKLDFAKIVGTNATIRLNNQTANPRYFNGIVARFAYTGGGKKTSHYRLTLTPWLWLLTRTSDCRIFQKMKVFEIVQKVFRDLGLSDFDDALKRKSEYEEREFTVQYRETAFNFVSRLMEEEGIYYYFEHQNGKHVLVLADDAGSHTFYPDYKTLPYYPFSAAAREQEYVWDWMVEQEIQPGMWENTDYDFEDPGKQMSGQGVLKRQHAHAELPMFDYPGVYKSPGFAEPRAKTRLHEYQAGFEIIRGRGDVRGLAVGSTFTLDNFPVDTWNGKEFLVTSAVHQLEQDDYDSAGEGDAQVPPYRVAFTCILATQPFRPRRLAPKPLISGPQTAVVVGPSGEEIHTDKYGRVKVQFHWDRNPEKSKPEDLTCWMRVAQTWAGKKWGTVFLPRVGHEVVVGFLEGDPDRPLIIGSVYNNDNMPPYPLPDKKTQSTVKSNSSKGGGGDNEILFEDKKGEEMLYVHAQKDQNTRVGNDRCEFIGRDTSLIVKRHQKEEVEGSRSAAVGGDDSTAIGGDRSLKVKGKDAVEVTGQHSLKVADNVAESFDADCSRVVTGDLYIKAANICIEADTNITLKVNGTHIAIEADSIKIGATAKVEIKGDSAVDVTTAQLTTEGSASATHKGAKVDVKADGPLTLKGTPTAVN
jgi:type VI secretion system secreted protein VgrG